METKTVTFTEIEYHELDELATKFLNKQGIKWRGDDEYFCVAEQEWGNDESHSVTVTGKITKDEKKELLKGELGWRVQDILNWMAAEGIIPKGEVRINICW